MLYTDVEENQELDKKNSTALGGLLIASKALDIWFLFVAANLVYDLAMALARSRDGLPIGFAMTHIDFRNFGSLFEPLFWTSVVPLRHRNDTKRVAATPKLCAFAGFVALMCVIANLMGPATSVLILPNLRWISWITQPESTVELALAGPPRDGSIAVGCESSMLALADYSCTSDMYSPSLAALFESDIANEKQSSLNTSIDLFQPILQEGSVTFAFNNLWPPVVWAPNRQVLRNLSHDYEGYYHISDSSDKLVTYSTNKTLNNTVDAVIYWLGPAIGVDVPCWSGNVSTVPVADDKEVRCYRTKYGWADSEYNECIRTGHGWSNASAHSQFFLGDSSSTAGNISVDVYFTDRRNAFNSSALPCSTTQPNGQCDWDEIFSANTSDILEFPTQNVGVLEFNTPSSSNPSQRLFCQIAAYIGVLQYALNPSPYINSLGIVQTYPLTDIFTDTEPSVMHPDWILAAWSVKANGTVDGTKAEAKEMVKAIKDVLVYNASSSHWNHLLNLNGYAVLQAMSMVNYHTIDKPIEDGQLLLEAYVSVQVWAYGLGSRTSKMAAAVVIAGCICVLLHTIIAAKIRMMKRSTHELLLAALEHQDAGHLHALSSDTQKAKVRYEIKDEEDGRISFVPKGTW
jgi:hypothetical protein